MFPFRPSRVAAGLFELAEAMLAPGAVEQPSGDEVSSVREPSGDAPHHPHRRGAAIDRRRRPAPAQPEQACLAPLTRAGRVSAVQRTAKPS